MSSSSSSFLALKTKKTKTKQRHPPPGENRERNQRIRSCPLCLQSRIMTAGCRTGCVKALPSGSYRVWKVVTLKARWGGKHSPFPQYPAGFGPAQLEPAHPAQPAGRPSERIQASESTKHTLNGTPRKHL